ncbi:MAG TPA: sodium:proton antiporter [Spirochaetia bacterium]|nr:sodium:proton antiporter [Spirochaetales bacterium]HRY79789.1 sodium:proton antiporter [Spirochaetia bacterium]HRZ88085.1 sodium:proton antiporter [Spirochaetia bacterium]
MSILEFVSRINPVAASGAVLVLVGVWGVLARPNLFKIAIATSVLETGVNLVILSTGYIRGRTAPILDSAADASTAAARMTDPVPQALVLTAIVIGLAVTALQLSYAVRLRAAGGGSSIESYGDEKW